MNNKKICFITCVNNEEMYQESVLYIKNLLLPQDFEIEFIAIHDAACMTKAYNQAMQKSDAKYKVYLHQDVFIVNKNFILYILDIFAENDQIGMIGIAGTEKMPTSAYWWKSKIKVQHVSVYDNASGKMCNINDSNCEEKYARVAVIDGLVMVTQYDILWREDIFDGWHFYDMSQSIEFAKRGYQVVVPNQLEPWCIHDCGVLDIDKVYDAYRNVFLDEYSAYLFPLVSILIPTYNRSEYFRIALESAINQTYRNIEVIICDSSSNEETTKIIEPYLKDSKVTYLHDRNIRTKEENLQKLKVLARGDYINWLMDDALFDCNKITAMMQIYLEHDEVSLVTSHCPIIDAKGEPIESFAKLDCEQTSSFDGRKIGKKMLLTMANFIGDPTTVLIKRDLLDEHYRNTDSLRYKMISDVAMWLELLAKGRMVYIAEDLSSCRKHEQYSMNTVLLSRIEWFELIKEAYEIGYFIENIDEYRRALSHLLTDSVEVLEAVEALKPEVDQKRHTQYIKILLEAKAVFNEI